MKMHICAFFLLFFSEIEFFSQNFYFFLKFSNYLLYYTQNLKKKSVVGPKALPYKTEASWQLFLFLRMSEDSIMEWNGHIWKQQVPLQD